MTNTFSSDTPWDDDDSDESIEESMLDALDPYLPVGEDHDQVMTVLFTATNPADTISVTSLMDGRILRVELSPAVTRMTESELAEEITVIAALSRQQAQAGQHAIIAEYMRQRGHDQVATRSFLERDLGLPSPQTALTEKARVFATRYDDDCY